MLALFPNLLETPMNETNATTLDTGTNDLLADAGRRACSR